MAIRQPKRGTVLVSTKQIPRFRILTDLGRRTERFTAGFMREAQRQMRTLIHSAPEGPEEATLVLAGALARSAGKSGARIHALVDQEPLGKSAGVYDLEDRDLTLEEARGLTLIAHTLRKVHGAPTGPGGLVDREDTLDFILGTIPFRMGRLVPDRAGARRVPEGTEPQPSEQVVSLVEDFHLDQNADSKRLRAVFQGELDQDVVLLRHPVAEGLEPAFTVVSGVETFLASLWLGIPALDATVLEPEQTETAEPPKQVAQDMAELTRALKVQLSPFQYRVPPAMEPLAEMARRLERTEFVDAAEGRPGREEIERRQAADLVNATRERVWITLYQASRLAELTEETAKQRADGSPEVKRLRSTWRPLERKAVRLEEAGHALREEVRKAKAVAGALAYELALTLSVPRVRDAGSLWYEARVGQPEIEDELLSEVPGPAPADPVEAPSRSQSTPRHPNLYSADAPPWAFFERFKDDSARVTVEPPEERGEDPILTVAG